MAPSRGVPHVADARDAQEALEKSKQLQAFEAFLSVLSRSTRWFDLAACRSGRRIGRWRG